MATIEVTTTPLMRLLVVIKIVFDPYIGEEESTSGEFMFV
jgi:hypothetical protein